ncbi:MAG TPA: ABC transporter permease [Gaiellaceae bacterium]|nr:ABC transporter permease [Gaiellaceae bacterium]
MSPDRKEVVGGQAGLAGITAAETGGHLGETELNVRARGYWEQVWRRFRSDKVAIGSAIFIVFLALVVIFGGPIAERAVGHSATAINLTAGLHPPDSLPVGPLSHVKCKDFAPVPKGCKAGEKQLFVLGADGNLGHDEFLRLLYGGRVSLEVAIMATIATMIIAIILGTLAGYYRGLIDTAISRVIELTMVFPALLFIIALSATVGPRLNDITFGVFVPGVVTLIVIFAIFGWFYPARILRAQVLSLREKEFVEAARMIGASDARIMRSHIIPHLIAPIVVYSTLTVATYILLEAGLSFLGLGIDPVNPSWGNLLSTGPTYYTTQPWLMVWPGLAILSTTLAFNLLGDGIRDAIDPRSTR